MRRGSFGSVLGSGLLMGSDVFSLEAQKVYNGAREGFFFPHGFE